MSKPADSELRLLRQLWRKQPLSAREIHDASCGETEWSYSTTRKTLDRMVDKGLLAIEVIHGIKTFSTTGSKLETLAVLISDFARNVLDADAPLPAATFAHSKVIDSDEIDALEALLQQLEQDEDDSR